MIVLPILAALSLAASGFHQAVVNNTSGLSIGLENQILVIILPTKDEMLGRQTSFANFTIKRPNKEQMAINFGSKRFLQVIPTSDQETVTVYAVNGSSMPFSYWLLPSNLCSGVSYFMTSDYSNIFGFEVEKPPSSFCIFSQTSATSYETSVLINRGAASGKAQFYSDPSSAAASASAASGAMFKSKVPFFIRFGDFAGNALRSSISFTVKRPTITSSDCDVEILPFTTDGTLKTPSTSESTIKVYDEVCISAAEKTLKMVVIVILCVVMAVAIVFILHCYKVIDVFGLLGYSKEEDRFKDIKANPYVSTIENPNDDEEEQQKAEENAEEKATENKI